MLLNTLVMNILGLNDPQVIKRLFRSFLIIDDLLNLKRRINNLIKDFYIFLLSLSNDQVYTLRVVHLNLKFYYNPI